jgi:amino acid adenylation domain-containing protein
MHPVPSIDDVTRPLSIPLSFAQTRLWFLEQLHPGTLIHCNSRVYELSGPLDVPALGHAFRDVFSRHEALRTRFESQGGEPVQVIDAVPMEPLQLLDLSGLPEDRRREEAEKILFGWDRRSFDLAHDLPFRCELIRLGATEHLMVTQVHHLVSDAWSRALLYRELEQLYAAHKLLIDPKLPELTAQYADYAVWQRQVLDQNRLEKRVSLWRERLEGIAESIDLPADRPRPAIETFRGAAMESASPADLCDAVGQFGASEGATPFTTWFAGFLTFLHRYSGKEQFAVGVPLANRGNPATENLIGFFANTLALRADFSSDLSFRDLIRQVKRETMNALVDQDLPFEKLVEELQPERNLSHAPVFQTMFAYQNVGNLTLNLDELDCRSKFRNNGTSKVDLSLYFYDGGRRMELEYSTELFDPETARRMLSGYITLMKAAVRNPDESVSRLPLLEPEDRRRLLTECNSTRVAPPPDPCIHTMFERQVHETPHRVAAQDAGESLNYAELDRRANRIAAALVGLGVKRGDPVALWLGRSVNSLAAVLGVLKAGACYVPLDPEFPRKRIQFLLEDTGSVALISELALSAGMPEFAGPTLMVDRPEDLDSAPSEAPIVQVGSEDVACILHTSGSTGTPKGVEVLHRGVVNALESIRRLLNFGAGDSILAITTWSFDISMLELFLPLFAGGRTAIVSRDEAADALRLQERIREYGITVMQGTPSTWHLLLDAGWPGEPGLRAISGGEHLSAELARRLRSSVAELWNFYGPTETTIYSTGGRVDNCAGPPPIGRPLGNTRVVILDKNLQLCPAGVPGEICIGGAGLAKGYRNRPEATVANFITDPVLTATERLELEWIGDRLYRSGDIGRRGRDGAIECLGRRDSQVKLRGHRIELGEIEACLRHHATVSQAVVLARGEGPENKELIAYVVPESGESCTTAELRQHVEESLPLYMVPNQFVLLAEVPLTPNGKLDRPALARMGFESAASRPAGEPPRTPVERQVAEIWSELLDVKVVSRQDDFFSLGGHSLLAMRAISRLERRTGVHVSPMAMMSQNLSEIAASIVKLVGDEPPELGQGQEVPQGRLGRLLENVKRIIS